MRGSSGHLQNVDVQGRLLGGSGPEVQHERWMGTGNGRNEAQRFVCKTVNSVELLEHKAQTR